jgi:SAM-dependent methyltransferase
VLVVKNLSFVFSQRTAMHGSHGPDRQFWHRRFEANDLPWDRGQAGPQLLNWLAEGLVRSGDHIAVPGCGSGHDVLALARAGCHVTGLDYAPAAVAQARQLLAEAGLRRYAATNVSIKEADVLNWQPPEPLDAIYEQTCFCALHPDHWAAYARQLHSWLRPGGQLLLMVMQCVRPGAAQGRIEGPPYHMDIHMVRSHLTAAEWDWPAPPYAQIAHPRGWTELAVVVGRR